MKDLWDSLCILKCHFNCFKCKFFGMHKRYGVSNDFSCIRIKNSCKIQMNSVINNMSKIRSPYNIGSYRADIFCEVWYLDIWKSYICTLCKLSSYPHFCKNGEFFHESSGFFKTYSHTPSNTPMTIPRMSLVERFQL